MDERSAEAAARSEAMIAALGQGQPMPSEGADRKYVVDGRSWRVRLQVIDQRKPVAPVNGEPELAPVSFGIGVSVALLDENEQVATDDDGALLVFDQHSVSIDAEALGTPDFDPVEAINYAIANEIAAAASILTKREQLATALAAWEAPEQPEE